MSTGVPHKSGFQTEPEKLKGIPPRQLVQMNSLQPSQIKRWVIKEAKRRDQSLSTFIRACLSVVKENPSLLDN